MCKMSIKYLVLGFEPIKHVSPTITTRPVLPPEVSSKLCPIVQIQCHGDTQIAVAKIKYQKFMQNIHDKIPNLFTTY